MSVRPFTEVNSRYRKKQKGEYDFVKEDLHSHIAAFDQCKGDQFKENRLMTKINQLKAKISKLNLEKGTSLANKLKTKWYNEGERSNKYFLALLRRKEINGQLTTLEINGTEVTDTTQIENHVTEFYRSLYNQKQEQFSLREKEELLRHMDSLTDEEIGRINRPLTTELLYQTLKDTNDSCPGPDGIPYSYLKVTWNWFGPVLLASWLYSQRTKTLPDSHKTSWLRLIPKAGKNPKDLKNWRPITLSNCDHKIITKCLSRIMADSIERIILGNQTAYLKGRSISDNLRLVALANKLGQKDRRLNGLLIALDARKAFDSVNHTYIKEILEKIGLRDFIPVFELLYKESKVDIMINDKLCKGYKIGNGVKQGDALSCTLFILAMEPLIRNIEANPNIQPLRSESYSVTFPKCIGYPDDINVLTVNSVNNVRATITEYEKFTKISGLHLNAEKTEIFNIAQTYVAQNYHFAYRGQQSTVTNQDNIKINGLELATDPAETHRINFESVKNKVDSQLAAWSNRGLTLLGKILIYKTFGLAQIIYLARVLAFTSKENSEPRNLAYKFIWNRNYQAAKAPDRIKRTYLSMPVKKGGFGMFDHESITMAMNAKQVLVNWQGTHPIKCILKTIMVNPDSSFNPVMKELLDGPGVNYTKVITKVNEQLLGKDRDYLEQDRIAKDMLLGENLRNIARQDRRNCIELTILRNQGKTTIRQLLADPQMANHYRLRILNYKYSTLMDACLITQVQEPLNEIFVPIGKGYKTANKVTSKELREQFQMNQTEINFKYPIEKEKVIAMLPRVNKLRCIRAKNLALRLLHRDVYTGTRLLKFGLKDNDQCPRCKRSEDIEHLLKNCWYTQTIWQRIIKLYKAVDQRRQTYDKSCMAFVIGANLSKAKLKLHLEIIRRLMNKERPNVLPKALILQALDYLIICDREHGKYYRKLKRVLQNRT